MLSTCRFQVHYYLFYHIPSPFQLAGDETSHDSGSDLFPTSKINDPLSLMDGDEEPAASAKKAKKKKKKKHKHKDKNKEQNKSGKLDLSNTNIPGVHRALLDDRLAAHNQHQSNSPLSQSLTRTENEFKLDNVTEMMDSDELSDM